MEGRLNLRTRIVIGLVALMFLAAGGLILAWTYTVGMNARALAAHGVKATGQVTDFQTLEHQGNRTHYTSYELRYTFEVPGDDTTYEPSDDILGHSQGEVWVDVPKKTWEHSQSTGQIAIEYVKGDPHVNWPVAAHRGLLHVVVFSLLGLVFLGLGLLLTRGLFIRARRDRTVPEGFGAAA